MKRALLERLLRLRAKNRPVALLTELDTGRQSLIDAGAQDGDLPLGARQLAVATAAINADYCGLLPDHPGIFVETFNPPLRLIVVGAVHIAQALAPMAAMLGYRVSILDPRRAWATDARFPDVTVIAEWPDSALPALDLDQRSAVVTLSHDPKLDDPALEIAVRSPAFYIGALGSRKTHAKRLERLRARGLGDAELGRIHGPAGLSLGGRSPAEIAVAILAQMTWVLHETPGGGTVKAGNDLRTDIPG